MNIREQIAWKTLLRLGARPAVIENKHALDLTTIQIRGPKRMRQFCTAYENVVSRSGQNKWWLKGGVALIVITTDGYPPGVDTLTTPRETTKPLELPFPTPKPKTTTRRTR